MNIDELGIKIKSVSKDKIIQNIPELFIKWKNDSSTVEELSFTIEKYIGNIWIENKEDHEYIYTLWSQFYKEAIENIKNIPLNERLSLFCLTEKYNNCTNQHDIKIIYDKLLYNE